MPLIIPSNSISGEFEVANSLRFDDGSSDYLTKTYGSAGNRKIWTWSGWVKRSSAFLTQQVLFGTSSGASTYHLWYIDSNDGLTHNYNGTYVSTNAKYRDPSAWYHFVCAVDTTQATASDRVKIYVNGSQVTSFAVASYPSQNTDMAINNNIRHDISNGGSHYNNNFYFDGYMAEVCFIDGQALDPTSFGEFDEDTGIWKPINVSGLTFGTNGFYLDFENSGSLGNDKSGNGNNFTVNNLTSIDQTTDTPTNNYATINGLDYGLNATLSDGNLSITSSTNNDTIYGYSNLGVMSGKYYIEAKQLLNTSVSIIGVDLMTNCANNVRTNNNPGNTGMTYRGDGQERTVGVNYSFGSSYGQNDIVSIALDMDNYKLYFAKNGVWQGSGDPDAGTGGLDLSNISGYNQDFIGIVFGDYASTDTASWQLNFGNPPFTIASGNSDGNGYGNFEHAVPSGYYSLNTKNLAEYG